MSRRSGQNGYIERKGNAFYVRFWIDVAGQEKRVHKSVRICPVSGPGAMGKSERERRAKEIIRESGADTEELFNKVKAANLGTTFRVQSEWWLKHILNRKRKPVKERTAYTYASHLRWINEKIGGAPLSTVNNLLVRQLVSDMDDAGFDPTTIKSYLGVVRLVVASAVSDDGNPLYPRTWNLEFMDVPEINGHHTPSFTAEQIEEILTFGSPYRPLYTLLAAGGLRIGEALALEPVHITPDGLTISIRQTLWFSKSHAPKTKAGIREIDFHPSIAQMLLDYMSNRKSGFIFQSPDGKPLHSASILRDLHAIEDRLGIARTGFHGFRRFRITHLRKQRTPEDLIRFWIGHGNKTVTDDYCKLKDDVEYRRQVAASIGVGFSFVPIGTQKLETVTA